MIERKLLYPHDFDMLKPSNGIEQVVESRGFPPQGEDDRVGKVIQDPQKLTHAFVFTISLWQR